MSSTAALRRPAVLADLLPGERLRDVLLIVVAAAFVGALAQVSIHLPFTPVPITGQTLGVLVAGCGLGWWRGASAMLLYLVAGLVGIPWFAGGAHGWAGPSMGYLVGFVLAATVCGALAERGTDRSILSSVPTMLIGEVCIYLVGVPWLAISLGISLGHAISLGLTPFLAGDAIKLAIAAGLLPTAWWLSGRRGGDEGDAAG